MKSLRFLVVLALMVAVVSSFAMAADYSVVKDAVDYEIAYESGNLTLTVVSNVAYEVDSPGVSVDFDKSAWKIVGNPTSAVGTAATNAMTGLPGMSKLDYVELTNGAVLLEVVFAPVDGATQAGTEFKVTSWWYETAGYEEEKATYTYKVAAAKEDPTYVASVNPKATFDGANDIYTGVWVGAYTVALKGNTASVVTVKFDETDAHNYTVKTDAAGDGSIAFKIAVLGAPVDAVGTPVLDGVAAIAE